MFWGLTIEPGKHYTQTVEESFHVSMAALETRDVASPERDKVKMTQLMVQHDKAEFLVCTLCYTGNIFQQYLDLNFTEGEEVTFFSEGRATIHLTGYLVRDEPLSMDPDMMSLDEASSSDEAASNSEEDEDEDEDEDNEDDGDRTEMSLQQLAIDIDLEDDDDDDDGINEWKPKDGKTKRKKQQTKTSAKRQHVEEFEPRKAKKLAELEISKSSFDGSDDEEDDDYSPVNGIKESGDDEEGEDSDDFIGWELEDEDDDENEEDDEDSEEEDDALYDEGDSDYDENASDMETALRSRRSKTDKKMQLKTKSTEKQKRVLRARESTPPKNKTWPVKSSSKKTDAGNKENIDRRMKQQSSSPRKTDEMSAPKTPTGKTQGTSKGAANTQAGKVMGNNEVRQSPRGKTPVKKPELKTPSGKTPSSVTTSAETPGRTPGAKAQGGSTPGRGEGKTPKGKGNEKQQPKKTPKKIKLSSGTMLEDVVPGDGKVAKSGKMVFVYYRGLLHNGKEFDSCLRGKPFMFRLGKSEVIKGWDEGIAGMKVGGKRKLTIPPSQGYGHQRTGIIPANSTLVFNVELKNVK